jgi:hypothetical protein
MNNTEINYLKSFWNELEQAGVELSSIPMPALSDEDFYLYQKTGNRIIYEKVYFLRRKYLMVFGILAEYEKDIYKRKNYIEKLVEIISDICTEKFWALPAHVDFNNLDVNTVDLFASETGATLAEMLIIFGDLFPTEIIEKVKENIMTRVLKPFCTSKFPYSWWETDRCNWSAVCGGNVGMTAIYMDRLGVLPKGWKEPCIKRACAALNCYLGGIEDDGAVTEGLYYFSYGMSYYTAFAELLYEETKGEIDLMANPKCEKIALFQQKCYFGGGVSLSFSDASTSDRFLPGLTAFLANKYKGVQTPDYILAKGIDDDDCYRWVCNERNIKWLMKYGTDTENSSKGAQYDLLPTAQWMICKDKNGNGYAAKGGNNDENHNHNDIGNFLVVYGGDMLIADLGSGEYTKDYFHEGRYNILCNRALGHNVPLINDLEQCQGAEYKADEFIWNENNKELEISFESAYPDKIIDSFTRKIIFDTDNDFIIKIKDIFIPNTNTKKFTENLVSIYKPTVTDKNGSSIITIQGKGDTDAKKAVCKIVIDGITNIKIVPKEHALHDGNKTTIYLIQFEVPFNERCDNEVNKEKSLEMVVRCQNGAEIIRNKSIKTNKNYKNQ